MLDPVQHPNPMLPRCSGERTSKRNETKRTKRAQNYRRNAVLHQVAETLRSPSFLSAPREEASTHSGNTSFSTSRIRCLASMLRCRSDMNRTIAHAAIAKLSLLLTSLRFVRSLVLFSFAKSTNSLYNARTLEIVSTTIRQDQRPEAPARGVPLKLVFH
jgi:hypothetical protein